MGLIAAMGFTGIFNISAQDMSTTPTNDTSQMHGESKFDKYNRC